MHTLTYIPPDREMFGATGTVSPNGGDRPVGGFPSPLPFLSKEGRRLAALRRYAVLDTPPEPALDDLVKLAAQICATPTALVALVDEHRQWFKAMAAPGPREAPLETAFCTHVLHRGDLLVVPDATRDPRFASNPLVTAPAGIRFYAGAPLITPDGETLGTLCVVDQVPRTLTAGQEQALTVLSRQVMTHLELRRHTLELTRRERLLTAIFEAEPECVCLLGADGAVRLVNPAGLQILEADSSEQILDRSILPMINAEDRPAFQALTERVFKGKSERLEFRLTGLKGTERWIALDVAPLVGEQGEITDMLSIARDRTEPRRLEEALRHSEADLRAAQTRAHLGSWEMDLSTGVGTWSEEMRRLHHFDSASGQTKFDEFLELLHPEDRPVLAQIHTRIETQDQPLSHCYRTNPARGPVRHLQVAIEVLRDSAGRAVRLVGTTLDVTELKRSEGRLRRLIDSNAQGVYFWDVTGKVLSGNDAFLKVIGYTREELEAGSINWMDITPYEFFQADERILEELAEKRVCVPFEKEYIHKDGSRVPVLVAAAMFEDNPREGVCFVLDLTERKKLEEQFLRAQRMEGIGTLAGGIAHDLNNALAPILLSLDILKASLVDSDSQELLDIMQTCAQRGADMVRQVLSFSRGMEGQRLVLQPRHLVREILQITQETFPKSIRLNEKGSTASWSVEGDPTQLHQVLLNLCVNARDAMPDGGEIFLSVEDISLDEHAASMLPGAQPGAYVLLRVEDNGLGMPRQIVNRIFDPFFTTKEQGKGTGLGLSTVLGIVKSHRGFVTVDSKVAKGTVFCVYLPAADQAAIEAPPAPLGEAISCGQGELILMVDDETSLLMVTRAVLEQHGYRVMTADNGADAIAVFAREKDAIALVLLDVAMPILDGPMVMRTLKKIRPDVKVIVSSGHAEERQLAELRSLDVLTILAKPFSTGKLLEIVEQALKP